MQKGKSDPGGARCKLGRKLEKVRQTKRPSGEETAQEKRGAGLATCDSAEVILYPLRHQIQAKRKRNHLEVSWPEHVQRKKALQVT